MGGWVYFMTNGPSGTLYVGVSGDIVRRVAQHRDGSGSSFCREHGLTRLVHAEWHDSIEDAIAREKAIKRWKLNLIGRSSCEWRDLWDTINN